MKNYIVKYTTQFKKDYKLAKRRGLNLQLLQEIVKKLASGETLDDSYKDHALTGKWIGYRECHIQRIGCSFITSTKMF